MDRVEGGLQRASGGVGSERQHLRVEDVDWDQVRSAARDAAEAKRRSRGEVEAVGARSGSGGVGDKAMITESGGGQGDEGWRGGRGGVESRLSVTEGGAGVDKDHVRVHGGGAGAGGGGGFEHDGDVLQREAIVECLYALRASLKEDLTSRLMKQAAAKDDIDKLTKVRDALLEKLHRIGTPLHQDPHSQTYYWS